MNTPDYLIKLVKIHSNLLKPERLKYIALLLSVVLSTAIGLPAKPETLAATVKSWCTIDDHTRPLPGEPPDGWFYNQVGGDRGVLLDYGDDPVEGVAVYSQPSETTYKGEIVRLIHSHQWEYLGFWYSIGHSILEKALLDPNALFHPMILPAYQAKLTGLDVLVTAIDSPSGRDDLTLKVDLKGFNLQGDEVIRETWQWVGRVNLLDGAFPKTFSIDIDPTDLGPVGVVVCILDKAVPSDAIEIDRLRLRVQTQDLSTAEDAFVTSLAMLLDIFDDQTGMVQDRSFFPKGDFENVTATAKLAKLLGMAIALGIVDANQAENAVVKIADTLLNRVPQGPAGIDHLWPHFTQNGGTERNEDSEWASGDTAYALLDLIVALQMIGDPQSQLQSALSRLKAIDWQKLRDPDGGFSHGYDRSGNLLPGRWYGFGTETLGVIMAALAGAGLQEEMGAPPSDNGSGFIYHAGYPLVPGAMDRWGNDWLALRVEEAEKQIGWYASSDHPNPHLARLGLFGLSAAERPEGWHSDAGLIYQAYGTRGRWTPPNDGSGHIVVLHYSGMIAPLNRQVAEQMWESLKQLGILSPLSNMESMAVDPLTGEIEQVNYLKGSWNLSLQAEGWGLSFSRAAEVVEEAFHAVPELSAAYTELFPRSSPVESPEQIIVSDGENLISIPLDDPSNETVLASANSSFSHPQHPVTADHHWLWFDAVDENGPYPRRALWRILPASNAVQRMTTDPYGRSYDMEPVPSPFHPAILYLSNRSGTPYLKYACSGSQGPGFGSTLRHSNAVAAWSQAAAKADIVFVANKLPSLDFYSYRVSCSGSNIGHELLSTLSWAPDRDLALSCERLDMAPDADRLLISTPANGLYIRSLGKEQTLQILPNGKEAAFSPDGRLVAFVDVPPGELDYELFTAEIAEDLSVADIRQITFNNRDDLHPTWFNPPYVFPSEHDFGDVIAGEKSNPKTFTIYSNGVTLNIETVRVTGDNAGEFRILGDACTGKKLEPGENCNVVAIFAPDSEGSKTATMVVSLDGSDSIPIASQLRGEGVRDTDSDGVSDKIEEKGCTSPNDADTDDDGISDGVEDANQNGLFDDGETDPCNVDTDGDGIHDGVEDGNHNGFVDFWETDPADWNSVPAFIVHLSKGFNLIGIHAAGELRYWLPALGDDGQIEKVMAYDDETGLFVTLIPGDASSENYTLDGAEGLIVYAKQDKAIGFNSLRCFPMDLKPGSNLVGFGCPPDGYTAFQLLKDLGGETVSSIQRYSPNEGAFQTAGFADDEALTGIDFPTLPGEGYFVFSIVDTPPTCYFDKQCAVDSFCEKSIGDCSGVGRCVGIPDVFCPDNYDPVCGCDGRTHSNGCYALVVGVSIDYVGECN